MADYKVTDTELTSIANAIRTKGGTQAQLEFPAGFVSAVQAIPTGGGGVVQPLSVTQNGIYNPPSGVDGYAPVKVHVQGGVSNNDILFHFNDGFENSGKIDSALFNDITGLEISNEQSKFGGNSLKCGTTQIIGNVALAYDFEFGNEDFTLDFWLYPTNLSSVTSYFSVPVSFDYRSIALYINTGIINTNIAKTNGAWAIDVNTPVSLPNNEWVHLALIRDGSDIYLFVNGVKVDTFYFGTDAIAPTKRLTIGSNSNNSGDRRFQGYIDEFRLKLGEAVWTSDFTPPTQPYA
jgi:hypothetical protein